MNTNLYNLMILNRADVTLSRKGWITEKDTDSLIGMIRPDVNVAGEEIWRAQACDMSAWAFKRTDAVQKVLDIWNINEKARVFDLMAKRAA